MEHALQDLVEARPRSVIRFQREGRVILREREYADGHRIRLPSYVYADAAEAERAEKAMRGVK